MKKVLILGAGLVVKPMVEYLLKNNFELLVASPMKDRADEMINGNPHGSSLDWSMDDPAMLEKIVAENDIVVSLTSIQVPFRCCKGVSATWKITGYHFIYSARNEGS
jgi:saccharopine dehydrogenase-like NADP-dependent oxidoreductase